MMKNLLSILFIAFAFTSLTYAQAPSFTITQSPTSVDENGESVDGPESFKMEIRNWPINDPIYVRIKLGSVPNAGGDTDWLKLAETEFQITGPNSTNAASFITVTNQEEGDLVTYNGIEKQGYNLDLEWDRWSDPGVGPWFGDAPAPPSMIGEDLIVGGAGFWNFEFTAAAAVDVLGAPVMTYNVPTSTEDVKFKDVKLFPNPTTGVVNISGLEDAKYITIHNIVGQEVRRFSALESSLDISGLDSGIYILQSDNGLRRRIVKR